MITYTTNEYGLRQKDMDFMIRIFEQAPAVEQLMIYRSRATGRFQPGADVDLAIAGPNITARDIAHIHDRLENDAPALLWYDVLHYDTLKSPALKLEIDSKGSIIYRR